MNTQNLTEQQIEKAAEWWAKAIRNPKFDMGDNSPTGGMATMLMLLLSSKNEPAEDRYEEFKQELASLLRDPSFHATRGLDVDYHPDSTLQQAADNANVDSSRFPIKTHAF